MTTQKSVIPFHSFSLRAATLVVGALSAAVVTATPAVADTPPGEPTPAVADPLALGTSIFGAAPFHLPIPLPIVPAIAADPAQPAPEAAAEIPEVMVPAAQVAPTPSNVIRIGNVDVGRPDFIAPEVAVVINDATMGAQNGLSGAIHASGVDASRSDQIAADVIGTAVQGAVVGAVVASPIAAIAAVMGAAVGLVVALPFAPAGFIFMPIIASTLAIGMVTLPFAAAGAGIGAIVGAVEGSLAPPVAPPAAEVPVAPPAGEVPAV
ncbi:hypothetical protein [Nocardia lijiangensis]|uniref:hypothetical protein n=1 Tax=Nocardia lijiangensis TaxID=299618 RepID=UPI00082FC32C|nr:hypothetical protein [Nocardia lijiangensis]